MTSNPSTPDNDGPKTETTLTTRIRINIPGSRPIPPVVVRKPVKGGASAGAPGNAEPEPGPAPTPAPAPAPAPVRAALPARPTDRTPPPAAPAPAAGPAGGSGSEPPAGGWFAPRKATPPPAPAPAPAPAPPAGAGYGSATPPGGTGAGFAPPAAPGQQQPQAAYGTGAGFAPPTVGGPGVGGRQDTPPPPPAYDTFDGYDAGPSTEAFPAFSDPAGPTGGPALGTVPVGADEPSGWPGPQAPSGQGAAAAYPPGADAFPPLATTPKVPAPGPQPDRQSRTVPAPPAPAGKGAKGSKGPKGDAKPAKPARPAKPGKPAKPAKAATTGKPAKKGRSKVVLLGGGLIALVAVAYGAGLLMNHSDVPKGTSVLGVDIGGTREEAVAELQKAFGTRASAPLPLTVGGKQVELKPDKAGLTLDSQTTVRNAAGSDYNPVTVIGSLFGGERTAEAVMPVDEEKLRVALQEAAGTSGSSSEGTIRFDTGKAVAVPGKAGTGLDVDGSVDRVIKAFREFVATGKAPSVELPTATKEPTITQAELDRAMKEFAEPAMSAPATVKAGGKSLPFGAKSLPKILTMHPVDGRLVEKYDLEALKATYGNTFDGVLITRGTGAKTPVTPQDVAGALGKALIGKTPAERTVTIDTNAG
ncbi:hypothetical protein [Streptomyces sp. NPDC048606]|uniref:hypothetical protein n=1 Tax=Streptomyces sp. NPDC048606 TaxID=3154726 RepID=UPI0034130213